MTAEMIAVSTIEEDEGIEEDITESDDVANTRWHLFGTDCQKEEIEFLCQVLVLYTIIVVSIYNLMTGHDISYLWTAILSRQYVDTLRCDLTYKYVR